jgi:hypothetical protein
MNPAKRLSLPLGLVTLLCVGVGCSSFHLADTARDAIDRGYISGLSASNHLSATVFTIPLDACLPYSDVESLRVEDRESSTNTDYYTFYMGKSRISKKWEVFSVLKWQSGRWELVPVKLPDTKSGK